MIGSSVVKAAIALAALSIAPQASATVVFADSFQGDLSQWSTRSGLIATAPTGGKALTFAGPTAGGDAFTLSSFVSGSGTFTLSFDVLGNCGHTSQCGGFVGATGATPESNYGDGWIISDTPYGGVPNITDSPTWRHISFTFAADPTQLFLEDWAGSANSRPDAVFFRNLVLTDNPGGLVPGTFSQTAAVPEPSTWAMLLIGFASVGLASYWRKEKIAPLAAA
jgi:hypothetical protein